MSKRNYTGDGLIKFAEITFFLRSVTKIKKTATSGRGFTAEFHPDCVATQSVATRNSGLIAEGCIKRPAGGFEVGILAELGCFAGTGFAVHAGIFPFHRQRPVVANGI